MRVPEATGIPDMSQGFAFELRMTDVSAEGRPSHTWPLLTMGKTRVLDFWHHINMSLLSYHVAGIWVAFFQRRAIIAGV